MISVLYADANIGDVLTKQASGAAAWQPLPSQSTPIPVPPLPPVIVYRAPTAAGVISKKLVNVQMTGAAIVFDEPMVGDYTTLFSVHTADGSEVLGTAIVETAYSVTFYPPENGVTIRAQIAEVTA